MWVKGAAERCDVDLSNGCRWRTAVAFHRVERASTARDSILLFIQEENDDDEEEKEKTEKQTDRVVGR